MATDMSDRFALPFLSSGQAQKEMTHNEALAIIDMLLHARAESAGLSAPPGGASAGQCWIVAASASAEWTGHEGELACLTSGGWRFAAPRAGVRVMVADEGAIRAYDGAGWVLDPVRGDGFYLAGERIVGPRAAAVTDPSGGTVIDSEARAVLAQVLTVLRGHGLIEIS